MPLVQTRGAASAQGFGEFAQASGPANYIEDVFSTFLYTGTGATQTITNNIDLSTKGGLVWIKGRSGTTGHRLTDTARGVTKSLASNATAAEATETTGLTAFGTTGFTIGADADYNTSAATYVSWTFREQAKFFDVVTWSGDGTGDREISHDLGSAPGCIILKNTSTGGTNWFVYHRALSTPNYRYMYLQDTAAANTSGDNLWNVTSTTFRASSTLDANNNGQTYVAYLFAHNAGGFGLTGTDNVISCGSYTGNGSATTGPYVNLGYEPQWLLLKGSSNTQDWYLFDTMRGLPGGVNASGITAVLYPNGSYAEGTVNCVIDATGFRPGNVGINTNAGTYIYIAIRRGPMKVPTLGTSVFDVDTRAGSASIAKTNSDILTDLAVIKRYTSSSEYWAWTPRLVGNLTLQSSSTDAELSGAMATSAWDTMTGAFCTASNGATNTSTLVDYSFRRAPGFFDVVCYTGTGSNTTFTHNLTVVPELIIVKRRDTTDAWDSYSSALANTEYVVLNTTAAKATGATRWNSTTPTSSVFSVGTSTTTNASAGTYVAYLFATCAGVSKCGSYTGTGTTLQVNCGFTGGARFVLIKRTDSTGDWYVWDSARGIVAGNDPYLLLNSTAAEVTSTDYIDTYSAGFEISSTAPAAINASAGTFIFLAIA